VEYLLSLAGKVLKKLQRKLKVILLKKPIQKNRLILWNKSLISILIGVTLLIFGSINYYKARILSFNKVPVATQKMTENSDIPVEIIIPSINIDLKVDPGEIKSGVWQISAVNATFLASSAIPGNNGNTVIYGHNQKIIFGNLPYLSIGQKIIVKTKSGKIYNYIAKNKYFVGQDRVDLVSPTNEEVLTIYTCWGLFDSQRVVVIANRL